MWGGIPAACPVQISLAPSAPDLVCQLLIDLSMHIGIAFVFCPTLDLGYGSSAVVPGRTLYVEA